MKRSTAEKGLKLVLVLGGLTMFCAIFPALMPVSWMSRTHQWLGLGEFPQTPVVEYLARTLSVMYAVTGGFSIMLATNIPHYRPLIAYFAWIHLVMGALYTGIDYLVSVPPWWYLTEGPSVFLLGVLMLYLLNQSKPKQIVPE